MIKFLKLGVFAFFTVFILGVILCGGSSANTSITPAEYVQYLIEKGKEDPEALEVKEKFRKLSFDDKKKFIYYATNPQVMKEISHVGVSENSKKVLYDGDIVITRESRITILDSLDDIEEETSVVDKILSILLPPAYAAGKIYHMRADDHQVTYTLGIKSISFRSWVIYNSRDRTKVISIQDGNGSATSYWPTNKIVKDSVTKFILGNKAHTCLVWKFGFNVSVPYVDFSSVSVEWNHRVLGSANGQKTCHLYKG